MNYNYSYTDSNNYTDKQQKIEAVSQNDMFEAIAFKFSNG